MNLYLVSRRALLVYLVCISSAAFSFGQGFQREFKSASGNTIEIVNLSGRIDITTLTSQADSELNAEAAPIRSTVSAVSSQPIIDTEIIIESVRGRTRIEVLPSYVGKRIDLSVVVPERTRLRIKTTEGEVRISGNIELADVTTTTGTIAADVPVDEVKYKLLWTASRPRFLSDFELEKVKEGSGGKFEVKGTYKPPIDVDAATGDDSIVDDGDGVSASSGKAKKPGKKVRESKIVNLNFTTDRGIILLNIPPNEVASDLRERPLTAAAKAIVRSGDSILTEAIRRASPKYFGDYARTLPPMKREPAFSSRPENTEPAAAMKRAAVRVTDQFNRAMPGLTAADFVVTENGIEREILKVDATTAPFNLVLLVDVSGSVDNYVNFIRKAARNFVDTVDRNDRVSIVLFNDDVKVLSKFTTDKGTLSESLDTFDAGGATAYYDALAYTLADTLRPMRGERTAIVVLTDGDDNRSFLSFDGLLGSIQESGALIYPLYVPSALIATSESIRSGGEIDPLRTRYMTLTTKAEGEGAKLASISGGIYYPITQLSQIQKAFDDIVVQLRTAYAITYRSDSSEITGNRASPRTKVRVKRVNLFANLGPVSRVREQ